MITTEKYKNVIPSMSYVEARPMFLELESCPNPRERALKSKEIIDRINDFFAKYIASLLEKIEIMENNSELILAEILLLKKEFNEFKKRTCE